MDKQRDKEKPLAKEAISFVLGAKPLPDECGTNLMQWSVVSGDVFNHSIRLHHLHNLE